jgi:hypothetical protein
VREEFRAFFLQPDDSIVSLPILLWDIPNDLLSRDSEEPHPIADHMFFVWMCDDARRCDEIPGYLVTILGVEEGVRPELRSREPYAERIAFWRSYYRLAAERRVLPFEPDLE